MSKATQKKSQPIELKKSYGTSVWSTSISPNTQDFLFDYRPSSAPPNFDKQVSLRKQSPSHKSNEDKEIFLKSSLFSMNFSKNSKPKLDKKIQTKSLDPKQISNTSLGLLVKDLQKKDYDQKNKPNVLRAFPKRTNSSPDISPFVKNSSIDPNKTFKPINSQTNQEKSNNNEKQKKNQNNDNDNYINEKVKEKEINSIFNKAKIPISNHSLLGSLNQSKNRAKSPLNHSSLTSFNFEFEKLYLKNENNNNKNHNNNHKKNNNNNDNINDNTNGNNDNGNGKNGNKPTFNTNYQKKKIFLQSLKRSNSLSSVLKRNKNQIPLLDSKKNTLVYKKNSDFLVFPNFEIQNQQIPHSHSFGELSKIKKTILNENKTKINNKFNKKLEFNSNSNSNFESKYEYNTEYKLESRKQKEMENSPLKNKTEQEVEEEKEKDMKLQSQLLPKSQSYLNQNTQLQFQNQNSVQQFFNNTSTNLSNSLDNQYSYYHMDINNSENIYFGSNGQNSFRYNNYGPYSKENENSTENGQYPNGYYSQYYSQYDQYGSGNNYMYMNQKNYDNHNQYHHQQQKQYNSTNQRRYLNHHDQKYQIYHQNNHYYNHHNNNQQKMRSFNFLNSLRNKKKKSNNFQLSEVIEFLPELCKDQFGSRFIQKKLQYATEKEKDEILNVIEYYLIYLIQHVFGNYVIQRFFEYGSNKHISRLVNMIFGHVFELSMDLYGCRVIQKALEVSDLLSKRKMVKELEGNVLQLVYDQNGNHVIQKCIECLPTDDVEFIIKLFAERIISLGRHPYGCRAVQRILKYYTGPLYV
ncbi:pumilio [Anaeramoeba flamelloides]|uniref:Pumilio n=1 Tax=Anaeramoeba flamelloides TaxID=1746091 RepID=A0AAV7ZYP7_9EUKA|nr:pumilio [Anaeramoeba flamelloides]